MGLEKLTKEEDVMDRMLVVVFDNEKKAYQGQSELRKLEAEGSIGIYDGAIVVKHADGTVSVKELDAAWPVGTLSGTAAGSLIGLLGGPVGLAVGAATGLAFGAIYDAETSRVGVDFVDDVSKALAPNKVAVVAEIEEEWTVPVDTRMEAIGGTVFRRALWQVEEQTRREEKEAMKADIAQFKSEIAQAKAEHKAKLQKKVDQLQAKLAAQQKQSQERFAAFQARQKAKKAVLKKNAAAVGRALDQLANTPV
jgi:uncharacterized membrane protein